jgi:hypothetical protein
MLRGERDCFQGKGDLIASSPFGRKEDARN